MSKKHKNRSDIVKDYFKEHPDFDMDYDDTFGEFSLDSLISDSEQPLSIEDSNLFVDVGRECYIPSDASDVSDNINAELGGLTAELSKHILNITNPQAKVYPTESTVNIGNQIED
jgi:hypothetical protein